MIGDVRLRYVYLLDDVTTRRSTGGTGSSQDLPSVARQKLRVEERRAAQLYARVSSQAALRVL
jgi:hypothetical protein